MAKTGRVPNLVELGRRPPKVRYLWVAHLKEGGIRSGATWMTLRRFIDDFFVNGKWENCRGFIKVIDLREDVIYFTKDPTAEFMTTWRENYFNYNWDASGVLEE